MQRSLPLLSAGLLVVVLSSSSGCVQRYVPPSANEPHAILKFRRTYEATPGRSLREAVNLGEHRAYESTTAAASAGAPRMDAILAHPVPVIAQVDSVFFHLEVRTVQEQYTAYEYRMRTESYSCGMGSSYRTCTRSVSDSVPVTRWRTVTRETEVPDGACAAKRAFQPADGHVYLLQYTYRDHGACDLQCVEQVPTGAPGEFRNQDCPVLTAAN